MSKKVKQGVDIRAANPSKRKRIGIQKCYKK